MYSNPLDLNIISNEIIVTAKQLRLDKGKIKYICSSGACRLLTSGAYLTRGSVALSRRIPIQQQFLFFH